MSETSCITILKMVTRYCQRCLFITKILSIVIKGMTIEKNTKFDNKNRNFCAFRYYWVKLTLFYQNRTDSLQKRLKIVSFLRRTLYTHIPTYPPKISHNSAELFELIFDSLSNVKSSQSVLEDGHFSILPSIGLLRIQAAKASIRTTELIIISSKKLFKR